MRVEEGRSEERKARRLSVETLIIHGFGLFFSGGDEDGMRVRQLF